MGIIKQYISRHKHTVDQYEAEPAISLAYFTSVFDLPADHWNQIAEAGKNFLFSERYLSILEQHPCKGMFFHYVIAYMKNAPVGILYFQETDVHITDGDKHFETANAAVQMGSTRRWIVSFLQSLKLRVLVNGNLLMSGPHGAFFLSSVPMVTQARILNQASEKIVKSSRSGKKIKSVLIKDIDDRLEKALIKIDKDLTGFEVQPAMVIPIRNEWSGFDDVMVDYRSKYRIRARRALLKTARLDLRELDNKMMSSLNERMLELYQNVEDRSDFNMVGIQPRYFLDMKADLGTHFVVKGFFDGNKLIGFYSYIRGTGENHSSFIGLDYDYNKQYSLYQNMLYGLLDDAVKDGAGSLDLARTALEIKSTVGAEPVNYRLMVKHLNGIFNSIARRLARNPKPVEWIQRRPFKKIAAIQKATVLHLTRGSS